MRTLLPVLVALLPQTAPSPSPPPELTYEAAGALLQKSPAFTGANGGRRLARVRELKQFQEDTRQGWLAEFEWNEGGKTRVGVAPIARAGSPHDDPWYFEQGGWAMAGVAEDKTIEQVLDLLQATRLPPSDSDALADVRKVLSAEAAYRSATGGFGELRCLAEPAVCIPGSKEKAFVSKELASLATRAGYRRKFYPGPKRNGGISTFAYTAVPVTPGETAMRGFCGDDTGRICFTIDGSEPPVQGGRCAPTCQELK